MEAETLHTLAAVVAYDGLPFAGFARQPGRLTVQGNVEDALAVLYRRPVETTCAGRTDSGVHARGQVVSFDIGESEYRARTPASLRRSLDALADDRITLRSVVEMRDGFSARFDALAREYRYFMYTGACRPVLLGDKVWQVKRPLDIEAMRTAAAYLIGEHDFKSFCTAASSEGTTTCRRIISIDIQYEEVLGEQVLVLRVVGNAFLHSMVRTIVGTLAAVGTGRHSPSWVQEVLKARNRRAAGETAPARGLILWQVTYDQEDHQTLFGKGAVG